MHCVAWVSLPMWFDLLHSSFQKYNRHSGSLPNPIYMVGVSSCTVVLLKSCLVGLVPPWHPSPINYRLSAKRISFTRLCLGFNPQGFKFRLKLRQSFCFPGLCPSLIRTEGLFPFSMFVKRIILYDFLFVKLFFQLFLINCFANNFTHLFPH